MSAPPLPRQQFPVTERYIYLNHAGIAPIPQVSVDAMHDAAIAFRDEGGLAYEPYDEVMTGVRAAAARLAGVSIADVTFTRNTTAGIGMVASGLDWQPGDRVVVPNYEFPSNIYPWIALRDQGIKVDLIEPVGPRRELPLDLYADALAQEPTRVLAVSWVQFGYGWRTDLAELGALCRAHGTLFCVDAIQGLGVLPAQFEAWGVDVGTTDAYKWMLGPHGMGFATVSANARDHLRPLEPGWGSVAHRYDFDDLEPVLDDSARRYEGGGANVITIAGMGVSLDLLLEAGIDNVWQHVDNLCQRLATGLVDIGAELRSVHDTENRSAIVSFTLPGHDPEELAEQLKGQDIIVRPRAGAVRLSPHAYLTTDDIDATLAAISKLA